MDWYFALVLFHISLNEKLYFIWPRPVLLWNCKSYHILSNYPYWYAYIFQENIASSLPSYIRNLSCIIRTLKSLITCCSIICWGRRTNIARAFYEYICILETHTMFLARLYPLITKGSRRLAQLHRFKVHEKYQVFILWFLGMTK